MKKILRFTDENYKDLIFDESIGINTEDRETLKHLILCYKGKRKHKIFSFKFLSWIEKNFPRIFFNGRELILRHKTRPAYIEIFYVESKQLNLSSHSYSEELDLTINNFELNRLLKKIISAYLNRNEMPSYKLDTLRKISKIIPIIILDDSEMIFSFKKGAGGAKMIFEQKKMWKDGFPVHPQEPNKKHVFEVRVSSGTIKKCYFLPGLPGVLMWYQEENNKQLDPKRIIGWREIKSN
ncbi:hypothetical protein C0584_05980 [Candidatus Parcubacteria bacterium]|nr:MAG: hypothetical protein C0584_05980 [Candidatus Parcubacteria bacterium]